MVKYFFQFGFFPWNKNVELYKDKPYHPPNIIGVEKKEGYVLYDLIQLLALFFHRSILKVTTPWSPRRPQNHNPRVLVGPRPGQRSSCVLSFSLLTGNCALFIHFLQHSLCSAVALEIHQGNISPVSTGVEYALKNPHLSGPPQG